ncbi:hypothetical protein [Tardiphaga sp. 709]|uniref:hypothetical protein n=1 Tax=Tardiphaga sp. 709 TaxID=3076039 RepID=UPI0028EABF38|nr:hypothetical protein [Tardiphaga sp. 709]WNV09599.1 hypothetical protein RSO67_29825 [Tardiphaga sp. 709]
MPYPTKYNRQYDYVSYQNANPTRPLPATKVNADLNQVQLSTTEIIDFLKKSIRADGKIMNAAIGRDQIDPSVNLGFTPPTEWEAGVLYTANTSTVFYGDAFYSALVTHTSAGSFDPSKWLLIADFQAIADEAALAAINSNPNLHAISLLTSAADKGIVFTGSGTAMTFDLSAFSRTLLDDTTAGGMLTTLGVSAFAQTVLDDADGAAVMTTIGALPKAGGTMTGALVLAADPAAPLQAATKQYVDAVAQGLDTKPSVIAATTASITLSAPQTIDGIAVIAGDRVLVKNQSTASQNGIYVVAAGAWTRATDADAWTELPGAFVFVEKGTVNADCGFVCTVDAGGTIGSTNVTFAQFSGAGTYSATGGVTLTGTQFSLTTAADFTIKSNISGGTAAPTDNTITAVLDKQFGSTRGSVVYRGASGWAAATPGSSGQFWKTLGAGADPLWASIPGGGDMLSTNNLSDVVSASTSRDNIKASSLFSHPGCGRLTKSGANLLFAPLKGNKIVINSVEQTIPDAGVTLAPPATSGTLYYIYAYMVSTTLTLEASTTGHATQAGTGIEIKSGDATRTMVGWARTVSSAWVDSLTQRFVISYYNRRPLTLLATNGSDLTGVVSTSFIEVSTALRVEFIATGDDAQLLSVAGSSFNTSANAITFSTFGVDGVAVAAPILQYDQVTASYAGQFGAALPVVLSEGYHSVSLFTKVNISSGTWKQNSITSAQVWG